MEIVGISYSVNFFIKNDVIGSDGDALVKLMPMIQKGFMPNIGEAISKEGSKEKAIQLNKEEGKITSSVTFASQAILIQVTSDEIFGGDLLRYKIKEITDQLANGFGFKKASRAASIVNLIVNYDKDIEKLFYNRYLSGEIDCFEWSVRKAVRDSIGDEDINKITNIERGKAQRSNNVNGKISNIDVFLITCDSNTLHERQEERFEINDNTIIPELVKDSESRIQQIINR